MPAKSDIKTGQTPAETAYEDASPAKSFLNALRNSDGQIEIPPAARDFVKNAATSAKERAASVHSGAEQVTVAVENVVTHTIGSIAEVNRSLLQAAYKNTEATFAAVEKLSQAQCLREAFQLNVDLVRAQARAGLDQASEIAGIVRRAFTQGAQTLRDDFAKVTAPANAG